MPLMMRSVNLYTSPQAAVTLACRIHYSRFVNALTGEHAADIQVDSANVQAMVFESSGPKMYADLADVNKIAVIDREKRIGTLNATAQIRSVLTTMRLSA